MEKRNAMNNASGMVQCERFMPRVTRYDRGFRQRKRFIVWRK